MLGTKNGPSLKTIKNQTRSEQPKPNNYALFTSDALIQTSISAVIIKQAYCKYGTNEARSHTNTDTTS